MSAQRAEGRLIHLVISFRSFLKHFLTSLVPPFSPLPPSLPHFIPTPTQTAVRSQRFDCLSLFLRPALFLSPVFFLFFFVFFGCTRYDTEGQTERGIELCRLLQVLASGRCFHATCLAPASRNRVHPLTRAGLGRAGLDLQRDVRITMGTMGVVWGKGEKGTTEVRSTNSTNSHSNPRLPKAIRNSRRR